MGFQSAMDLFARKVDDVCLNRDTLLLNPEISLGNVFSPGAILRLTGMPAERKQGFFLETVALWFQMQSSQDSEDVSKCGKAASRLLWVTDDFRRTASYQTETESQSAAADLQIQIPATEPCSRPEDQATDAADGAEMEDEAQSPNMVIGDDDGHAPFGDVS